MSFQTHLECPKCKESLELNSTGREFLARKGPPVCPACNKAKMVEAQVWSSKGNSND